jgi:hypothetical protein
MSPFFLSSLSSTGLVSIVLSDVSRGSGQGRVGSLKRFDERGRYEHVNGGGAGWDTRKAPVCGEPGELTATRREMVPDTCIVS